MRGLIAAFARHRIAPNLLMLTMIAGGLVIAAHIEKRFFPKFEIQIIQVNAPWRGASTEDVGDALLTPIENQLRNVGDLKKMVSYASDGGGVVYLEFPDSVNLDQAADDVRRLLDLALPDLPADAEAPEINIVEERDGVLRIAVGGDNLSELRTVARRLEEEIVQLGFAHVEVRGLPKEEIEIRLSQRQLNEVGLTPRDIGEQIRRQNVDTSAGNFSTAGSGWLLRTLSKRESVAGIADLTVLDARGNSVRLGDIADIVGAVGEDETTILFDRRPAVELVLQRRAGDDILQVAEKIHSWINQTQARLPPGISLTVHDERWRAVESRLNLLVKNGLQGLVLVLLLLFLFLSGRVAFWVAMGIPATFMMALSAMFFLGGSINMLSMFALIMTTGIVVDDAIVAGENALFRLQQGARAPVAAIAGVREMFPAVLASTFTTLASFLPLFIVGGVIGSILFDIPFVVLCVLGASLFECFLVLPGHLLGAFQKMEKNRSGGARKKLEAWFNYFQEKTFRKWVTVAVRYRLVTVAASFSLLALAAAMFVGGAVTYRFFPGAELRRVNVQADFVIGTAKSEVESFAEHLQETLLSTAADFPDEKELLRHAVVYFSSGGRQGGFGGAGGGGGDEKMNMVAELSPPDERDIRLSDFTQAWREKVNLFPGLENLTMREERGGPPGEDLEIQLSGADADMLKKASLHLQAELAKTKGIALPRDDMSFGKKQLVFSLTPLGRALGLSTNAVAGQLRDAFDGYLVQTFYEGVDEKELRVVVGGGTAEDFSKFRIRLPNGDFAFLEDVVALSSRRGFETIQRVGARAVVNVVAEVDFSQTDVRALQTDLLKNVLPALVQQFGVTHSFEGSSADERETIADMQTGLAVAFIVIFFILAAVFASWTLPLVVILTAPMAFIGAVLGHWLMGYEVSILSAFGVFTLNGIVVNDSIILVRDYLLRRKESQNAEADALIVDTACRRLRAMLVTSLTTICGLLPLLFERSLQAQFLIPMAISICFGLAFATLLVLFLAPAYLSYHESSRRCLAKLRDYLSPAAPDGV